VEASKAFIERSYTQKKTLLRMVVESGRILHDFCTWS